MQQLAPTVFQVRADLEILHEKAVNALLPEPTDKFLKERNDSIKKMLRSIENLEAGPIDQGNIGVIGRKIEEWRKYLDEF